MAIDPICKMEVDEETAEFTSEHEGKMYYFCAAGCKSAFEEDPGKYMSEESEESGSHEMHEMHEESKAPEAEEKKPWYQFW